MAMQDDEMLDPQDEFAEGEDPERYDGEPEAEGTLADEVRRQLQAAPTYGISAGVHAVILVILMLIPTQRPEEEGEEVVLETEVFEEIEEEEEEPEPEPEPEEIDPLEAVMEETESVSTPTEVVTETDVEAQVQIETDIEVETVVDEVVGEPTEDNVADASDEAAPNMMGVRGSAFSNKAGLSSGFRGGFGKIGKGIRGMVRGAGGGGGGRGLVLLWLLDRSASMKDDQEAVAQQARDIQELLTDGGRKDMFSGVITFGQYYMMTQEPTRDASRISDAILNVESDPSGKENTCAAITYACNHVMSRFQGWTKVLVLLTDESANDAYHRYSPPKEGEGPQLNLSGTERSMPMIEVARHALEKTETRLFTIGKESPFQSDIVREPFVDARGKRWLLDATRGPESAFIEVPIRNATAESKGRDEFKGEVLAGFGVYDLAYLSKYSKGAYFILDQDAQQRRPMTRSERARHPFVIDWELMDHYKPMVVSRSRYSDALRALDDATQSGHQAEVVLKLRSLLEEKKDEIQRHHNCSRPPRFTEYREDLRRRSWLLADMLETLGDHRASDELLAQTEQKRQIANLDLWYCLILADQIITEAWLDAYEQYKGPTSANLGPRERHSIVMKKKEGASLSEEDQAIFNERMRKFTEACNFVIRRHHNTPWAVCAQWMQGGPAKWGVPMEMVYRKWTVKPGGGGGGGPRPPRPVM